MELHEWQILHGVLMTVSFGVFTTVSVYVAYYLKVYMYRKRWEDLHLNIQLVGFLLCILGVIAIQKSLSNHMATFHSISGRFTHQSHRLSYRSYLHHNRWVCTTNAWITR